MLIHPLADDDYHLVQDYLTTKITFLLAKSAGPDEWEHEIHTLDPFADHTYGRRNAFLFDFTLARFLVALTATAPPRSSEADQDDQFVADFCETVDRHPLTAEAAWNEYNRDSDYPESEARMPSTEALLTRLLHAATSVELRDAIQRLPAELTREPAQN